MYRDRHEFLHSAQLIFLVVNINGNHWVLLTATLSTKEIVYYDSLMPAEVGPEYRKKCTTTMNEFLQFIKLQCSRPHPTKTEVWSSACKDEKTWTLTIYQNPPQQFNGVDCGVFALQIAECLSRQAPLDFNFRQINNYRLLMIYELFKQELVPRHPIFNHPDSAVGAAIELNSKSTVTMDLPFSGSHSSDFPNEIDFAFMDQTCPIEPEAKSSRRHLEDVLVLKRNWVTVGVPAFEKKTKQVINEYV